MIVARRVAWLALVVLFLASGPSRAGTLRGVARFVPDGDTLVVDNGPTVRLLGLDAPEMGQEGRRDQYYARTAREALLTMVRGKVLTVAPAGAGQDRFGRMLAMVALPDGTELNEALVRAGAAFVFWHEDLPRETETRLLAAQQAAMRAGAGFWPRILGPGGIGGPLVGNRKSRRFFPQDCPSGRSVSPANRVSFPDARAAFGAGYSPARPCGAWPLEN